MVVEQASRPLTQEKIILSMLRFRRPVTLGELFDAGVAYTGRNKIGELRRHDGFIIGQKYGTRPSLNAYLLVAEPNETVDRAEVARLTADGWKYLPQEGELFPQGRTR